MLERGSRMNLYYISFATYIEFLGATVVEGVNEKQAFEIATNNNLNPGGQAIILEVPYELHNAPDIAPLKYKLFNKEQMTQIGTKIKDMEEKHQLLIRANAIYIGEL
jgi:hypothetical protein